MSYSTNVPTFKGAGLNTVLIGQLRRDYERRQYEKKQREQQMLSNQAQYQPMMQAYYLPSVPTLSPRLTQDMIRFGGNGKPS